MVPEPAFKRPQYLDLLLPDVADTVRAMARQRSCDAEELARDLVTSGITPDREWLLQNQRSPGQAA